MANKNEMHDNRNLKFDKFMCDRMWIGVCDGYTKKTALGLIFFPARISNKNEGEK